MGTFVATLAVLAFQSALGGALFCALSWVRLRLAPAGRRAGASWTDVARTCRRLILPSALLAIVTTSICFAGWRTIPRLEPITLVLPGLGLVVGGLATAGCFLVLVAGRSERRGRLARARRIVSLGGRGMFLATAAHALLLFAALLRLPSRLIRELMEQAPQGVSLLIGGGIVLGLAGFAGLLAGLSRKPRPSGVFAAVLYVAALAALAAGAHAARPVALVPWSRRPPR